MMILLNSICTDMQMHLPMRQFTLELARGRVKNRPVAAPSTAGVAGGIEGHAAVLRWLPGQFVPSGPVARIRAWRDCRGGFCRILPAPRQRRWLADTHG